MDKQAQKRWGEKGVCLCLFAWDGRKVCRKKRVGRIALIWSETWGESWQIVGEWKRDSWVVRPWKKSSHFFLTLRVFPLFFLKEKRASNAHAKQSRRWLFWRRRWEEKRIKLSAEFQEQLSEFTTGGEKRLFLLPLPMWRGWAFPPFSLSLSYYTRQKLFPSQTPRERETVRQGYQYRSPWLVQT